MRSAAHVELVDVCRVDRQRDGARHQAVEVDPNRLDRANGFGRRLLVGLPSLLVLAGLGVLLVLGLVGPRRRTVVGRATALVGLRSDRRGRVPCQRDRVDSRRLEDRKIELNVRSNRVFVAARREIEILSIGRPRGIRIDSGAVSDARQFARRDFVQSEVAPAADCRQAQREPAPVRRKCLIVDFREFVLRDLLRLSAIGANDPKPVGAIRECQRFSIGGENRPIKVAFRKRREDFLRPSFRRTNRDLLSAARIGGIRDHAAVRRPGGMVFVRALRVRQIARRAVFCRYAENIASRREQRALAVWREREIDLPCGINCADFALDVANVATSARTIVRDRDGNFLEPLAG